ncbi:MAG: response regulator [Gammaproteobacteria bacterium]|nr:MAG: response regulator [Gammaproteobacteria bacterium]
MSRSAAPLLAESRCSPGLRVLIADDDPTSRAMLQALVRRHGCNALCAADGAEAVARFQAEEVDLVLLDVHMPRMDGYEAARRIKEAAGERLVPVLFLTGLTGEQELARCVEAGGDDFLTKPFSPTLVAAKIRALLRLRDLYETVRRQRNDLDWYQQRMEQEQAMAQAIFAALVAKACLEVPGVRRWLRPSARLCGDVVLACPTPDGQLHVLVGDFTGHGLMAAVGTVPLAETFSTLTRAGAPLQRVLEELNRRLYRLLPTGLFCAAAAAEVDPRHRVLRVWNGGLPDLLLWRPGGALERLPSQGLPLGVQPPLRFRAELRALPAEEGARLLVHTDGISEAQDAEGHPYGERRLAEVVRRAAEDPFQAVLADLRRFLGGEGPGADDMTLVEIDAAAAWEGACGACPKGPAREAAEGWTLSLELSAAALRRAEDPVEVLMAGVEGLQPLEAEHRAPLRTVLAELYANALEHGVLGLDSGLKADPEGFARYYEERRRRLEALAGGWVCLRCRFEPRPGGGRLVALVEDSGPGFEPGPAQPRPRPAGRAAGGRGPRPGPEPGAGPVPQPAPPGAGQPHRGRL